MEEREGQIKFVDEEEGVVILEEYYGEEKRYEIVVVIDIGEETYLILAQDDSEDSGEGYALKVTEDEEGNKVYQPVLDEDELIEIQKEMLELDD